MAVRARKICDTRGCPNLAPCPVHTPLVWAGSTRKQRLPKAWPRIRARILQRDPVCKACLIAKATEVDHITPGDDHSPENLQGLCRPCHARKSAREGAEARRGAR